MKTDDILKLIDAGFTKEEILKLDTGKDPEPEPTKDPEPEPTKDPEPEPTKDPEPEPAKEKIPDQTDMLKFIADQFEKMTKSIQESNIINSDTKLKNDNKTGPEVLAEVIAPPERKRGKTK